MWNNNQLEIANQESELYYNSDDRKWYSSQRLEEKVWPIWRYLQLNDIDKKSALYKILYVKNEVKKQVTKQLIWTEERLTSVRFSENNCIYLDVLEIDSWYIGSLDDISNDLKEKLDNLVTEISSKIFKELTSITKNAKRVDLKELDDFDFHNFRSEVEKKAYEEIKKQKDIPRWLVYLYSDMDLYKKLRDIFKSKISFNIVDFINEFIDYFNQNEAIFIERYNYNEKLSFSTKIDFELARL